MPRMHYADPEVGEPICEKADRLNMTMIAYHLCEVTCRDCLMILTSGEIVYESVVSTEHI